jgi:uncharacterized membrane protein HdeD (DUF308 family)
MVPTVIHSNWWLLALRALAAVILGLLTFLQPEVTLFVLVALFGIFCLINGILTLVMAYRRGRGQPRWWALALEGLASLIAGGLTLAWPGISLLGLLYVVALWAITTGIFQIVTAIRLRKQITGEWLLLLGGVLSVLFGGLVLFWPGIGALVLSWWIGGYLFAIGIMLGILSYRLRRQSAGGSPASSSMTSAAG